MALLEEGILDPRFGDVVNHDLASYHVPVYADVGEIGIVGTAAGATNAVHHATGIRFRRLPIRLDQVVQALA